MTLLQSVPPECRMHECGQLSVSPYDPFFARTMLEVEGEVKRTRGSRFQMLNIYISEYLLLWLLGVY